jgi:hypothetical protein
VKSGIAVIKGHAVFLWEIGKLYAAWGLAEARGGDSFRAVAKMIVVQITYERWRRFMATKP